MNGESKSVLSTNNLTQGLPFLLVFYKPPSSSHYTVDNFENPLESTCSSLHLDKTSNGEPDLTSMLKDDKKRGKPKIWLYRDKATNALKASTLIYSSDRLKIRRYPLSQIASQRNPVPQ